MRGSPLIRSLIVLTALIAVAVGLTRLATPPAAAIKLVESRTPAAIQANCPFVLTLSHPAKLVRIESNSQVQSLASSEQTLSGALPLDGDHPTIFLDVEWADPSPSPRFAKLVLEPPAQPTQTKVFDSDHMLSVAWELHLHE